jgi:hypothetical protein
MGLLYMFKRLDRNRWFLCYDCLMRSGNDSVQSIFHSKAPKVLVLERPLQKCPRCGSINTKSFQDLKNERKDSTLFGLERIAKKYPTNRFEIEKAG